MGGLAVNKSLLVAEKINQGLNKYFYGASWDTGISINQSNGGNLMLVMCSKNTGTGTDTQSAMYYVHFYYDGNNAPVDTYIGGTSDYVTFSVSATNTLIITGVAGNNNYRIISIK